MSEFMAGEVISKRYRVVKILDGGSAATGTCYEVHEVTVPRKTNIIKNVYNAVHGAAQGFISKVTSEKPEEEEIPDVDVDADSDSYIIRIVGDDVQRRLDAPDDKGQFRQKFTNIVHAAQCMDNVHVARVYASGKWKGKDYLLMEYVPGPTLKDELYQRLVQGKPDFSVEEIMNVILPAMLDGLKEANARGINHCDIRPQNVIHYDNTYCLANFKLIATTPQDKGGYVPPEMLRGEEWTFRSDLYTVGVMCWEILRGDLKEYNYGVVLKDVDRKIPSAFSDLIASFTVPNPDKRPGDVSAAFIEYQKARQTMKIAEPDYTATRVRKTRFLPYGDKAQSAAPYTDINPTVPYADIHPTNPQGNGNETEAAGTRSGAAHKSNPTMPYGDSSPTIPLYGGGSADSAADTYADPDATVRRPDLQSIRPVPRGTADIVVNNGGDNTIIRKDKLPKHNTDDQQ